MQNRSDLSKPTREYFVCREVAEVRSKITPTQTRRSRARQRLKVTHTIGVAFNERCIILVRYCDGDSAVSVWLERRCPRS